MPDLEQQTLSPLATPTELFFSEYVEGSSNNKALEIYNGTAAVIDLAVGNYDVQFFFNGNTTPNSTIPLTGTVAPGDVYVLADDGAADPAVLGQTDQTSTGTFFNGDDAIALRKNGVIIDVIGQIGFDPGAQWGSGLTSTADNTLRRKYFIESGDSNGSDAFDPAAEWDGFAADTFGGLGTHDLASPPTVSTTSPANGATSVAANTTIDVQFSEAVTTTANTFALECPVGTAIPFGVVPAPPGNVDSLTLTPAAALPNSTACTVTVDATEVTDQDG
ncbi:MAG: endonuclease, partial [Chloroflexi bacterium]|nr:endonuclease [Chloroflexota bacterium]